MPTIKVQVQDKIALNLTPEVILVCGNNDYKIEFEFDNDWAQYETKTAIFVANGAPQEVEFKGNSCEVPVIVNATSCSVGVEAGDLRTTTSAYIVCKKSIRDEAQNAFEQNGGEKYLTNYQKKLDERLETKSKQVVGAVNEVNEEVKEARAEIEALKNAGGGKLYMHIFTLSNAFYDIIIFSTLANLGYETSNESEVGRFFEKLAEYDCPYMSVYVRDGAGTIRSPMLNVQAGAMISYDDNDNPIYGFWCLSGGSISKVEVYHDDYFDSIIVKEV